MTNAAPRGIRNNNPGNLVYFEAIKWEGQIGLEALSPEELEAGVKPRFARFDTPFHGLRALALQLLIDQDKHGLKTPRAIISHYAPSNENDTAAYIANVDKTLQHYVELSDAGPDTELDLDDEGELEIFVEAIIKQEDGGDPYAMTLIDSACEDALKSHGGAK